MLFLPQSARDQLAKLDQGPGRDPIELAKQILEIDPDDGRANLAMANIASMEGRNDDAEPHLWRCLQLLPGEPMAYLSLAQFYSFDPATEMAGDVLWALAVWAAAFQSEVDPGVAQMFDERYETDWEQGFSDPEACWHLAQELDESLRMDELREDLGVRIRPYWLLKELTRGSFEGLSPETLQHLGDDSQLCIPLWRAVVQAWARDQGYLDAETVMFSVALLGEHAGAEILSDLWELSNLNDRSMFLHSHWALWRVGQRLPAELVRSVLDQSPSVTVGTRCSMAEHLGMLKGTEGAADALLALVHDFPRVARELDSAYLLIATAEGLANTGFGERAVEVMARNERLLDKEGRAWLRETLEDPDGFVSILIREQLPDVDIEDICLAGSLIDESEEDECDDELDEDLFEDEDDEDDEEEEEAHAHPKPGRNDPCWCGSGKKYKKCHLQADEEAARSGAAGEEEFEDEDPIRGEAFINLLTLGDRLRKKRDIMEAGLQYFDDVSKLEEPDDEASMGFLHWYLFDFRPDSTGRTLVEEYLRKNRDRLAPEKLAVFEAWRDSRYGLFQVKHLEGDSLELQDVFAGDTLLVQESERSPDIVAEGDYFLARLEKRGETAGFSGDTIAVEPDALEALKQFVDREIKTTGQTPAEFVQTNAHVLHRVVESA